MGTMIAIAIVHLIDVNKNGDMWTTAILPAIPLPAQHKVAIESNK